jgi:hypothetical protein
MPPLPPSFRRCDRHRRDGVNNASRPCPLLLLLLHNRLDHLPVGGVTVPPPTIRIHGSPFPPLFPLLFLLPPPSLLPCMPSPQPITLLSHLLLLLKRLVRPLSSSPRGCSILLDPIAPSPTPAPASPSHPCLLRLRCPLRRRQSPPLPSPPMPPPPSSSTLVDC